MFYALHPPLRLIQWARSPAQKWTLPKTTADLAWIGSSASRSIQAILPFDVPVPQIRGFWITRMMREMK